jgi:hypothetical protein
MRRIKLAVAVALSVAMCTSWAWGAEEKLGDIVEEEIWVIFAHDPAGYLLDAWENFLNGDLQEGAYNMRKAKALLRLEIYRADEDSKGALEASARELEKLAKAAEEGSAPNAKALKKVFAQTEHALAYHHYQKALDYQSRKEFEKMTYALDAAATHSLYASVWAEEELDHADAISTKRARSAVRKVIEGAKSTPSDLREAIKGIGRAIKELGDKISPGKEGS